jgi:uncharacterized protein
VTSSQAWPGAALYDVSIRHHRRDPVVNRFVYGSYYWLIDVDQPPLLPIPLRSLARFDTADHGAGHAPTLRQDIESFLTAHGIFIDGGPVSLLTHARVFGHVFNPLSVYWCRYADATPACVVAEVHNTYGGRHRYLLHPDSTGFATAAKEFFVSPFNAVDGSYRMWLPEPGRRLSLAVTLDRTDSAPFTATMRGERLAADLPTLLRMETRHPVTPLVGSLRIRYQGVKLALLGLKSVNRPVAEQR